MVLIGIFVLIVLAIVFIWNHLISKNNNIKQAFGLVDVYLKKRFDLIPNLVETAKTYMAYESNLLTNVTSLRARGISASSTEEKIQVSDEMGRAVREIFASFEAYPTLQANQQFLNLQKIWNDTEDQIAASRRTYNACVNEYNNAVEMFPSNLVANMLGYQPKPMLEILEEERKNISAEKLFGKQ